MRRLTRRRFHTAELMQRSVEDYFNGLRLDEAGNALRKSRRPTLSGLTRHLGFSGLSAIKRYEGYPDQDFKWVLDRARLRVMEWVEENGKSGFDVFHLKNLDSENWRDKTEQELLDSRPRDKDDKVAMLSRIQAALEERQLNAIPGTATVVEDDSWKQ